MSTYTDAYIDIHTDAYIDIHRRLEVINLSSIDQFTFCVMGTHPAQVHRQKIADRQASRQTDTPVRVS